MQCTFQRTFIWYFDSDILPKELVFFLASNSVMVVLVLTHHYTPCRNHFFAASSQPLCLSPLYDPFGQGWARGEYWLQKIEQGRGESIFVKYVWGLVSKPLRLRFCWFWAARQLLWALCRADIMQPTNLHEYSMWSTWIGQTRRWWNDKCWQFVKRRFYLLGRQLCNIYSTSSSNGSKHCLTFWFITFQVFGSNVTSSQLAEQRHRWINH